VVKRPPGKVSGMKSDGLTQILQEKGIKSLIMAGISTSNCVLSTARAASDDEFVVTVIEDACCDPIEGLHESMMKHLLPSGSNVITSEEWIGFWEK